MCTKSVSWRLVIYKNWENDFGTAKVVFDTLTVLYSHGGVPKSVSGKLWCVFCLISSFGCLCGIDVLWFITRFVLWGSFVSSLNYLMNLTSEQLFAVSRSDA